MALPVNIENLLSGKTVEWERLEFKKGWNPEEVVHTLGAYANDINNWGGGYIVIGVDENGGVPILPPLGVPQNKLDSIQKELLQLCHLAEPYIQVTSSPIFFQGKHLLIIWVPGGDERPYKVPTTLGAKGQKQYYIRKGSVSKIANKTEEGILLSLTAKIPFDDRICHQAEVSDLNLGLIRDYLQEVKSDLAEEAINAPFQELCEQMHLVGGTPEYIKPKNIGLLMFSEDPEKFIPLARIEIVRFYDDVGDKFSEKIFHGPIQKQLRAALDFLKDQVIIERVFKISQEAQAKRFFNYPFGALEEALSNAVYHKTYDKREPIEVRINPSSIEILNFEGPMPPVTNEDLQKEKVINRNYRNRRIGDFLKELHFTEGRSTGFPKIYKSIRLNGSPLPKFETDENNAYFLTTIYIHKAFIEPDDKSKKIMDFCTEPKSSKEILKHLGLSYHSYNLKKVIQPLVENYYIFPTSQKKKGNVTTYISRESISGK